METSQWTEDLAVEVEDLWRGYGAHEAERGRVRFSGRSLGIDHAFALLAWVGLLLLVQLAGAQTSEELAELRTRLEQASQTAADEPEEAKRVFAEIVTRNRS